MTIPCALCANLAVTAGWIAPGIPAYLCDRHRPRKPYETGFAA